MTELNHPTETTAEVKVQENQSWPKVSGFLENGLATVLLAVTAWCVSSVISDGGVSSVASSLINTALRISCLLILIQSVSEILGRETVLLRTDWQRFAGMATGVAMIACGGAVMSAVVPILFD